MKTIRTVVMAGAVGGWLTGLVEVQAGPVARWDMVPTGGPDPATLDVLPGGGDQHLYSLNPMGNLYPTSGDVPPASMFANGFNGGTHSFDSGAYSTFNAALYYPTPVYGPAFGFTGSFTAELFFKTDGDQSGVGAMSLLRHGEVVLRYGVVANIPEPGAVTFSIHGEEKVVSVALTRRNYCDGRWHGMRVEYLDGGAGGAGSLAILLTSEDGSGDRAAVPVPATFGGLPAEEFDGNLLIGRYQFPVDQAHETFLGLIDEVQIGDGTPAANELLVAAPAVFDAPVARWSMAPTGAREPASLDGRTGVGEGVLTGSGAPPAEQDHVWLAGDAGVLPTSADVPPADLFANGFDGGSHSFDAAALAGSSSALVFPAAVYGDEAALTGPFSAELFFKSNGDQSAAGPMQLLLQGESRRRWEVTLNEAAPGAVRFTVRDGAGLTASAEAGGRNFADGQWHYAFATFDPGNPQRVVSLTIVSESGPAAQVAASEPAGFGGLPSGGDGNLLIGRAQVAGGGAHRNFLGLIDEVQISRGIAGERERLGGGVPRPAEPDRWLVELTLAENFNQVRWNSQQHQFYDVFYSPDPSSVPWECISSVVGRTGTTEYYDTEPGRIGANHGFYRIGRQ